MYLKRQLRGAVAHGGWTEFASHDGLQDVDGMTNHLSHIDKQFVANFRGRQQAVKKSISQFRFHIQLVSELIARDVAILQAFEEEKSEYSGPIRGAGSASALSSGRLFLDLFKDDFA
jgi:hypothetical protein